MGISWGAGRTLVVRPAQPTRDGAPGGSPARPDRGVDPAALETAFRRHASSVAPPPKGMTAVAIDGKTLRGSFDAFADRKAAHMMSAFRQADQLLRQFDAPIQGAVVVGAGHEPSYGGYYDYPANTGLGARRTHGSGRATPDRGRPL